jgi:hypothetical protein
MNTNCSIVTVERYLTAVVKANVPFGEIPQAQRNARAKIDATLASLDVGALGRTCTRWTPPSNGKLPMETGTIVERPIQAKGEVVPSDLPAGRAAFFLMTGPFDGLPKAWETLFDWCNAQKLTPAGVNWEIYSEWLGVDPSKLETKLYVLLA